MFWVYNCIVFLLLLFLYPKESAVRPSLLERNVGDLSDPTLTQNLLLVSWCHWTCGVFPLLPWHRHQQLRKFCCCYGIWPDLQCLGWYCVGPEVTERLSCPGNSEGVLMCTNLPGTTFPMLTEVQVCGESCWWTKLVIPLPPARGEPVRATTVQPAGEKAWGGGSYLWV